MLKEIDNQIKGLLWFLFKPEASGEIQKMMAKRRPVFQKPAAVDIFQGTLKSAVWVSVSILLSLTLARLN